MGDGVLFFDANGDGELSETREYVFTEWDPTAGSDIEALRAVFDTNGDGVLDDQDDGWDDFRVQVTDANGATHSETLVSLGITSIDLTADATRIEFSDGSIIDGQTTFTRSDGSTGTVGSAVLVSERAGYRVEEVVSTDGSGNRVSVQTGYAASGDVAFVIRSVTSPNGAQVTNFYDDDGDGVADRVQTIDTATQGNGTRIETVVNRVGSDVATGITASRVVTTRSADGSSVTIERDSTGGGWYDQTEVQTTNPNGSRTVVISDLAKDGSVIRSSTETVSADGQTRSEAVDEDGNGTTDVTATHAISTDAAGVRTEVTTLTNGNGSLRSGVTEVTSADGRTRTVSSDIDGDGAADVTEATVITVNTDGSTSSSFTVTNANGSTRSTSTQTQSDDALTTTRASDVDGDGDIDVTTVDETVINADGSRVNTVTVTNTDGSIRDMERVTLGADMVTSETWIDLDQDGVFDATEIVRQVSVDASTGDRTAILWDRNPDGSIVGTTTRVTSADGLNVQTSVDADGDGDVDTSISDITTVNGAGVATRDVETHNQDGSLRSTAETTVSADGLTTTVRIDRDGDGNLDGQTVEAWSLGGDDSVTRTVSNYAGNGTTLLGRVTTWESADRRTTTVTQDVNGDGHMDSVFSSVEALDGSVTETQTEHYTNGTVASRTESTISANGLIATTSVDRDGDLLNETVINDTTALNSDGSRTRTIDVDNGDGSDRSLTVTTVSDDGLTTTIQTDANGDGAFERVATNNTVLNSDGSATTTEEVRAADGSLLSQSQVMVSDDSLVQTRHLDRDGDGQNDRKEYTTTVLQVDGSVNTATTVYDANNVVLGRTFGSVSDDGRSALTRLDVNGDGAWDTVTTFNIADDGVQTTVTSEYDATGALQSSNQTIVSDDGLIVTRSADYDGDGVYDHVVTDTTVLEADGSTTRTVTDTGSNGVTYRSSTIVTSDDGLMTTVSDDIDGDGTADLTTTTDVSLTASGVETVTVETRSEDGSLLDTATRVTSADLRTVTESIDSDGNGQADVITVSSLADNGVLSSATSFYSTGGALEASFQSTVSGDGLSRTSVTDRNGDGRAELITSDVTALGEDGSVSRDVEHRDDRYVSLGNESYWSSDDGLSRTAALDHDGDGVFEAVSSDATIFDADGDVVRTQITRDAVSDLMTRIVTVTSGDGLVTSRTTDLDGDGVTDRAHVVAYGADGSLSEDFRDYGAGNNLAYSAQTTVSADGRTRTVSVDLDGDGHVDREIVTEIDLSRNVSETHREIAFDGTVEFELVNTMSADGLHRTHGVDIDGDGVAEFTRSRDTSFLSDGSKVTTITETYGATHVGYQSVTTTSANGLSSVTTMDIDGDGTTDGTEIVTTVLNPDGSRVTVDETTYADGSLRSSSSEAVSADGRTVTETYDYDGNGIADLEVTTVRGSDGSVTQTETAFNEGGMRGNTFVTTTSADGLITTIVRAGNAQTITRSAVDDGSYVWDNGVAAAVGATNIVVSHQYDAFGVETWTCTQTWKYVRNNYNHEGDFVGTTTVTTSSVDEVRLDDATSVRLLAEAERVFDTVLDRDLDFTEREILVTHMVDGELDQAGLIADLLSSGEFSTRYGNMSDAEFVTQMYLNALGRVPGLTELDAAIRALDNGAQSRADLVLDLAESAEHGVVGNGHMSTNNFDVILNPAVYERSLDEAYVREIIENLVDVVYDRDATAQELDYLSELLLEGTDNPDDVATMLLGRSGSIQGVSTASLQGLTGTALVEQAFINALGRQPTAAEQSIWEENLSSGRITIAGFVAALAQSIEHLTVGNSHVTNSLSVITTSNGTSGNDSLTGGAGDDVLNGLGGNDTLNGGNGSYGSDSLIGGAGNDSLLGGHGNDFYVWSKGDGNDIINDAGTSHLETDTLVFTDLASSEVTLTHASGSNDLLITVAGSNETITIVNRFSSPANEYGIEAITFSDGVTWTLDDILENTVLAGTSTANTLNGSNYDDNILGYGDFDTLNGNGGNDVLTGGWGRDALNGGDGNDMYVWSRGDSDDRINDTGVSLTEVDTLVLIDVASDTVSLRRVNGSTDLQIVVSGTGSYENSRGVFYYEYYQVPGITSVGQIPTTGAAGVGRLDNFLISEIDAAHGGNGNNFALRVFGTLEVTTGGDYTFSTLSDDGWELLIDGVPVSNTSGYQWVDNVVNLSAGQHTIEIAYFEYVSVQYFNLDVSGPDTNGERTSLLGSGMVGHAEDATQLMNVNVADYAAELAGETTITVASQFGSVTNGVGIETISFSDGVVWTLDDIIERTTVTGTASNEVVTGINGYGDNLFGLAGNDTLNGNSGDDTLTGGLGVDSLNGGDGGDTYVWSRGDGNDTINDNGSSLTEIDTLRLTDVASTDVTLSRASGSNNLLIAIAGTTDVITIVNRYNNPTKGYGIEQISFSDGVIWTLDDILSRNEVIGTNAANTLTGTSYDDNLIGLAGADTLNGGNGDDLLVGGTGNDVLDGGNGNDRFEWSTGDGSDTLSDTGTSLTDVDSLILMDVASTGATLSRSGNHLIVTMTGGQTITVNNRFLSSGSGYGVEVIEFSDGVTTRVLDDAVATINTIGTSANNSLSGWAFRDLLEGLDGNDSLYGANGDDTLDGGTGVDYLDGQNGNDTYIWSLGDGNDTIYDTSTSLTDIDTLRLNDVDPDGVALVRSGLNIVITVLATGETITVTNNFHSPTRGYGLEAIEFADGTVWTQADIFAHTSFSGTGGNDNLGGSNKAGDNLYGLGGNDTLTGYDQDDVLVGGTGNDYMDGGIGNDTYIWTTGDGNDTIYDTSTSLTEVDTLRLTGVDPDGVSLTRVGLGIQIKILATDEIIYATNNFYSPGTGYGLEAIEFADGTVWTQSDIFAHTIFAGTNGNETVGGSNKAGDNLFGLGGNDTLIGYDEDDVLVGGTGNDYLQGGNGNDTYIWSTGDGNDTIYDAVTSLTEVDTLVLTDVASTDVTLSRTNGTYNLTIQIQSTLETITVTNRFYDPNSGYGIERIEFSDGVTWTLDDIIERTTVTGTAANQTLTGIGYDDHIFGLAGNDVLNGNAGDDVLYGGSGADTLNGGVGVDTASYRDATQGVLVDLSVTTGQTGIAGGEEVGDVLSNIEALEGSAYGDTLIGDANSNDMWGLAGNDSLSGGDGFDRIYGGDGHDTIDGGLGADLIYGGINEDSIVGGAGNDMLYGDAGFDTIYGDDGDDTIWGGYQADNLYGGAGNDSLFGEDGLDQIYGGDGNDFISGGDTGAGDGLFGENGDDTILGGAGDDRLWGHDGNDVLDGGADNDEIYGGNGSDVIFGGTGDDLIYGGSHYDTIYGGAGNDTVYGDFGRDVIYLEAGDDVFNDNGQNDANGHDSVSGGDGNDTLNANGGNDTLDGGAGDDDIWGGIGSDTFIFGNGFGDDVIFDFDALDAAEKIDLSGVTAITTWSDLSTNHMTQDGADVVIDDLGGNTIRLVGVTLSDLDASDFVF